MLATFKRLLRFWKPHSGLGAGLAVTMVLRAIFTVILALAIKFVIDQVIDPSGNASAVQVALLLVVGLCISLIAGLIAARLTARASADIIADVRAEVFDHIQRLPMQFHDSAATGDLIAHFSSDIAQLSQGVIRKPLAGLRAVAAMMLYIPAMILLDGRLAIAATVVIPVVVYVVYRWAPASASALDVEKARIADVLDEVATNLRAQRLLRAFSLGERTQRRFHEKIMALRTASFRAEGRIALESVIAEYGVEVAKVAIIVTGAAFAFSGTLDPGSFAAFTAILTEFAYQASVIGMDVLPAIKQSEAGIRRIDSLLAVPAPRMRATDPLTVPDVGGAIAFQDVVMRYHPTDATPQLDHVSLVVPAESYVAIVGPNGSGKSSVLSAMLGLYELESGTVTVGGLDIRSADLFAMRRRIGTAFQDTYIFDATVRENVSVAAEGCSESELIRACEESGLASVLGRLPAGIETRVGTDGMTLSAGEAQRIGLARALIRDPELLLLDEVAAGLDPITEAEVFSTVERIRGSRTIISVTHRLETVKTADLIAVVIDGRVVESGPFEALMVSGGVFSEMWTKQHGFDVSANGLSARVSPERLGAIPLFSDLDAGALGDLAATFHSERFDPGDVIVEEGTTGDAFFVIARGSVEVVTGYGSGSEDIIACLGDGDFFGEMALLSHARRNASVRASGSTTVLRLDQRSFAQFLATSPAARASVEAVAASRAAENEGQT